MIDDCTEFGRSTRMIRGAVAGRTLLSSGVRAGAGTFHDPSAFSTSARAAGSVMSPTSSTVVLRGEYIVLCQFATSSRVRASSDAFVPPLSREYGVVGS